MPKVRSALPQVHPRVPGGLRQRRLRVARQVRVQAGLPARRQRPARPDLRLRLPGRLPQRRVPRPQRLRLPRRIRQVAAGPLRAFLPAGTIGAMNPDL